jgi:DNA-nicking Smr family endonuclease
MSGKERGRKSPPEHLSPEDKLLWAHAMRDAKPARRRRAPPAPAAAKPPPEKTKPVKARRPARAQPPPPVAKAKTPIPALAMGAVVDVDRRTAERLKRGRMAVEATLDLHGHTQAEAHRELNGFLARAHAAGRRCVLIVTGKGASKSGGGVLRSEVPKWLNESPNRARIVAFAGARPQHGGGGALYVLLRRRRGE